MLYVLQIIYFHSRGPNKYTRNWEDEDAYGKTGSTPSRTNNRRFQKNNEDFPTLGSNRVSAATYIISSMQLIITGFSCFFYFLNFHRIHQLKWKNL